jgi:N-acetylglutamate synthase-like GNAT family acetyltransferase
MIIRQPHLTEVETIRSLFAEEVRLGRMLPRPADEVRATLDSWWVAEIDGRIVGCVSLVHFNGTLCEIRSLAVDPDHRGQGIAGRLIAAAVETARLRGVERVLTLTRAVEVFERVGFHRNLVGNFPEKVWRDCAACPVRHRCDEVALVYDLAGMALPVAVEN